MAQKTPGAPAPVRNDKDLYGQDICPMEKTVEHISDVNEAYDALKQKLESLKSREQQN